MTDHLSYKACVIKAPSGADRINVDEPIRMVMSDQTVDRDNEIVMGFKNLKTFLATNPVLRWMHAPGAVIGQVVGAFEKGTQTLGDVLLAEEGTSDLVDQIRRLVSQRAIRAGSVGFRVGKRELIDERDPRRGYKLLDNELHEFSLVDVGANPNALIAKAIDLSAYGLDRETADLHAKSATFVSLSASRDSDDPKPDKTGRSKMSLSERIASQEKSLDAAKEKLSALVEAELDVEDDQEQHDETVKATQEEITKGTETLESLYLSRKLLAERTIREEKPVTEKAMSEEGGGGSDASDDELKAIKDQPGWVSKRDREPGELAIKSVAYLLYSHVNRMPPIFAVKDLASKLDRAELEVLVKTATSPADTPTDAWAGNLVQETWGEFFDLLRDTSVYPQLPGNRTQFDRFGKINVPKNDGRGTLAGGFIGEGAPIPVKEGVIGITDLQPKALKVITSWTNELFRQSIPSIEDVVRTQILGDTAEALDAHLLGSVARDAVAPAGYQDATETGAGNINSSTGATVALITADLEGMVQRALAARASTAWVWIISQINLLKLRNKQDAGSGEFSFRSELAAGTLMGLPWVSSQNVQDDAVFLQGNGAVWYANAYAPGFTMSDSVLVFDDTAPDDIVSGGLATTQPTKSMFQTDSTALRMTWGLDYRIIRQGGVQVLDTVAW